MRSSRLLALLLELQRHGRRTAPVLARELGVSVRTIYRDVQALQEAGVPVWTESGPGGGIGLLDGWRSPVDGMTSTEVGALLVGPVGADLGMATVLATARSKVRSGLPDAAVARLDAVTERFHLDAGGWFREPDPGGHLPTVAGAVWEGRRLDLRYRARERVRARRVDPLGLVQKAGVWYLVATHRGRLRTFRVDRVVSATVRDDGVVRPEGFDLATHWAGARRELDVAIRRLPVTVRLPASSLGHLRRHVPGPLTGEAIVAAGERAGEVAGRVAVGRAGEAEQVALVVELPMESVGVAVSQLATVPGLEVLEPASVRSGLADLGRGLAARHGG